MPYDVERSYTIYSRQIRRYLPSAVYDGELSPVLDDTERAKRNLSQLSAESDVSIQKGKMSKVHSSQVGGGFEEFPRTEMSKRFHAAIQGLKTEQNPKDNALRVLNEEWYKECSRFPSGTLWENAPALRLSLSYFRGRFVTSTSHRNRPLLGPWPTLFYGRNGEKAATRPYIDLLLSRSNAPVMQRRHYTFHKATPNRRASELAL
ncbi:hypothetical protein DL766_000396 [Monosporascus sp. MC13-8B]|uniref:Uncharacterized protein n=1 Tax=Monosporascus cannonballus TaxID=155416 RepID=A0ABY0GUW6_9PEZI|nr:hypothetical protein DL762_008889 [Monosporascus cannonballus]RYP39371.1 hypothetical protein DL766_000396 [Monosporascus sp. MC13-8B]